MWLTRRKRERGEVGHPLTKLQSEMNRLFDSFFRDFGTLARDLAPWGWGFEGDFAPQVNVSETDRELKVTAELPGVEEKDIDVTVTRDAVTIRGEKRHEVREEKEDFYHLESSYGSFERTIPLRSEVVADQAEATFKNGVLTIVLPKTEESRKESRKIRVKGA